MGLVEKGATQDGSPGALLGRYYSAQTISARIKDTSAAGSTPSDHMSGRIRDGAGWRPRFRVPSNPDIVSVPVLPQ